MERYIELDHRVFSELGERADQSSEHPLQRSPILLNLLAELSGMSNVHPGCLMAAFTYETQQFDGDIRALTERAQGYRSRLRPLCDTV